VNVYPIEEILTREIVGPGTFLPIDTMPGLFLGVIFKDWNVARNVSGGDFFKIGIFPGMFPG
jgi:hypothetical protein